GPSGYGIGASCLGVQYVTGLLGLPGPGIAVESGYGTLILELGIIGPLLWLLWTGALVREGWRMVRRLRGTPFFPVGFAILWFAFLLLFPFTFGGMQPYQNFVFNAYLWLLTGILFRLPSLPVIAGSRYCGASRGGLPHLNLTGAEARSDVWQSRWSGGGSGWPSDCIRCGSRT